MQISLLNLISTPIAVLNNLGLNLRVGLSSEDPMVGRRPSEPYEVYLSVFSPEGPLLERKPLGQIPPERRKMFDVTSITRQIVPDLDHLVVVHRVPTRLMSQVSSVEQQLEIPEEPDYSFYRSMVEYSYPGGGNGSVIYETPPRLNAGPTSNTLTFTSKLVLTEEQNSYLVLINHSMNPDYSRMANYRYAVYSLSGEQVMSDRTPVGPFGVKVIDMKSVIPSEQIEQARDPQDGLSAFTMMGYSDDAALVSLVVNAAPNLGAVAVEHTHPPQTYLFPYYLKDQSKIKTEAISGWNSILGAGTVSPGKEGQS